MVSLVSLSAFYLFALEPFLLIWLAVLMLGKNRRYTAQDTLPKKRGGQKRFSGGKSWQRKNHMQRGMQEEVVEARPNSNGFGCRVQKVLDFSSWV
jgi:hypothetical protein